MDEQTKSTKFPLNRLRTYKTYLLIEPFNLVYLPAMEYSTSVIKVKPFVDSINLLIKVTTTGSEVSCRIRSKIPKLATFVKLFQISFQFVKYTSIKSSYDIVNSFLRLTVRFL